MSIKVINNIRIYKGLGFVEALIALMISGIVAVVLMSISANAMQELHTLDLEDELAQRAVSTGILVQNYATEASKGDPEENIFYNNLKMNQCYGFDVQGGETVGIDTTSICQLYPFTWSRDDFVKGIYVTDPIDNTTTDDDGGIDPWEETGAIELNEISNCPRSGDTRILSPDDTDFYRLFCIAYSKTANDKKKIVIKVFTGLSNMSGEATTDADIKDYEYYSVISL